MKPLTVESIRKVFFNLPDSLVSLAQQASRHCVAHKLYSVSCNHVPVLRVVLWKCIIKKKVIPHRTEPVGEGSMRAELQPDSTISKNLRLYL